MERITFLVILGCISSRSQQVLWRLDHLAVDWQPFEHVGIETT